MNALQYTVALLSKVVDYLKIEITYMDYTFSLYEIIEGFILLTFAFTIVRFFIRGE